MPMTNECKGNTPRVVTVIGKIGALIAAAAGVTLLIGPATSAISIDGIAFHQATIGAVLLGVSGLLLAVACWRAEPAVLKPMPADKVEVLAQQRRSEALKIIESAARGSANHSPQV